MDEALYGKINPKPERSIDEAAAAFSVTRDVLLRFIFAAPNPKDLAWLSVSTRHLPYDIMELIDLNEFSAEGESTESLAITLAGIRDLGAPGDWDFTFVKEFAVYTKWNRSVCDDHQLGLMAWRAKVLLLDMQKELIDKRRSTDISASISNIRRKLITLSRKSPSFSREAQTWDLFSQAGSALRSVSMVDAELALFPGEFDLEAHRNRTADPVAVMQILDMAVQLKKSQPRRFAAKVAEKLLRTHFNTLHGIEPGPARLGSTRADFIRFSQALCGIHGLPGFSDHVLRRR